MPKPNPGKRGKQPPKVPSDRVAARIDPAELHCITEDGATGRPEPRRHIEPTDAEARQRILEDLDTNLLVEASAGSGKTTSLVGRMIALLATGRATMDGLVAITFTRKAAAELRGRFQAQVEERARTEEDLLRRERLQRAVQELDRAFLGTIHAFCARLLRERPVEAGVDIGFREVDEAEELLLRQQAWDGFTRHFPRRQPGLFRQVSELGLALPDLRHAFDRLVDYADVESWPAPAVAPPDAGALRGAVDEYLDHCERLRVELPGEASDWLMRKIRMLPRLHRIMAPGNLVELMAFVEAFERPATTKDVVQKNWPGPREGRGSAWAKREIERWNRLWEQWLAPAIDQWRACRYPVAMTVAQEAARWYARDRRLAGVMSYQDLLLNAVRMLRGQPPVRRYFQERFTHLLVDEFQDTDPLQAELMVLLTSPASGAPAWPVARPEPGRLFVVGDPQQSIYRFRRADISTYEQLKQCLLAAGGAVVGLTTNFRTVPELVDWVNGHFQNRFPAVATDVAPAHRPLQSGRVDTAAGDLVGLRTLRVPEDGANNSDAVVACEADWIARTLRGWLDAGRTLPRTAKELVLGKPPQLTPDDVLIVTWRKNNLSRFGDALSLLGIPYQITGGTTLNELPELAVLIQALTVTLRPDDGVAVLAYMRGPAAAFSDAELFAYHQAGGRWHGLSRVPASLPEPTRERFRWHLGRLRRWFRQARRLPPMAALETIITDLALEHVASLTSNRPPATGDLLKLMDLVRQASPRLPGLADLLEFLEGVARSETPHDGYTPGRGAEPAVRIMNLHKVKGLEAPVVFLADATGEIDVRAEFHLDRTRERPSGYMALTKWVPQGQRQVLAQPRDWQVWAERERAFLEAERDRLHYVAATRAGCLLVVSQCARDRAQGRNPWAAFADDLAAAEPLPEPPPAPPRPKPSPFPEASVPSALEIARAWARILPPSRVTIPNEATADEVAETG
jgi:ATP-dependent helicase/nuclease subunit A